MNIEKIPLCSLQEEINLLRSDIEIFGIDGICPDVYHESLSRAWKYPEPERGAYLHGAYIFCHYSVGDELNWLKEINNLIGDENV